MTTTFIDAVSAELDAQRTAFYAHSREHCHNPQPGCEYCAPIDPDIDPQWPEDTVKIGTAQYPRPVPVWSDDFSQPTS